jgi:hypothetical protein
MAPSPVIVMPAESAVLTLNPGRVETAALLAKMFCPVTLAPAGVHKAA